MSERIVRAIGRCSLLCVWLFGSNAGAQIDLGALKSPQSDLAPFKAAGSNRVPLMIRVPTAETEDAANEGFITLSQGLFATYRTPEDLSKLVEKHGSWHWLWSPPRHLLLDQVVKNVHADTARTTFNRTGRNVIVGIVDTGIDLRHPDMRFADGRTRVAWYLDLTQAAPLGRQSELETTYGCTHPDTPCAVYSTDDINALLNADPNNQLPVDAIGHGTHVASLAAGNGLSGKPPKYIGIAPDANLVVVNASRQNQGDLQDPDIILGVKFVFDVARRMGMPAVVNLSLGGDAGSHDGTSNLERELSSLIGPDLPGRAIVVAAGNSADLYDTTTKYPAPLGIHTSVQVLPDGNKTRVPVVVDKSAAPSIDSEFIAWVQSRKGDSLSVGVDTDSGECIPPIPTSADPAQKSCGGAQVTLYNGITDDANGGSLERPAMALIVKGKFESPGVFALTFKGSGTAFIWVQSEGGLNPALPTMGALLPAATRERTIAIPASATDLIAVGATLNRNAWKDITGHSQTLQRFGSLPSPLVGDVASFSGGGPNQLDDMKPDILAPGGYVVGALASLADPRKENQSGGMFDSTGACGDTANNSAPQCSDGTNTCLCYLIDGQHGVAIGTSMASPLVAGTIALLFEANPSLTQGDVRRYLQAGAQNLPQVGPDPSQHAVVLTLAQEGPGLLDVNGALAALANEPVANGKADSFSSWMTVSTALIHPDDQWPTVGTLHLRDGQNLPVSIDASRISIDFLPGHLTSPIVSEGYGYYTFGFTGGAGTGRQRMHVNVYVDNQLVMKDVFDPPLYIGVDVPSARGDIVAGRGCGVASRSNRFLAGTYALLFALGALAIARRKSRAV